MRETIPDFEARLAAMPKTECKCDACSEGCRLVPGWFAPGEVDATARLLGISTQELFDRFLVVDYFAGDEPIDLLAPRKVHEESGTLLPFYAPWKRGACVFLKDGACSIHAAKPFECSRTTHDDQKSFRNLIAAAWDNPKDQAEVHQLLKNKGPANRGSLTENPSVSGRAARLAGPLPQLAMTMLEALESLRGFVHVMKTMEEFHTMRRHRERRARWARSFRAGARFPGSGR